MKQQEHQQQQQEAMVVSGIRQTCINATGISINIGDFNEAKYNMQQLQVKNFIFLFSFICIVSQQVIEQNCKKQNTKHKTGRFFFSFCFRFVLATL